MSRLSKRVREYVKCPQLDGGTHYGEWGALRLDQRRAIKDLCEETELFEHTIDKLKVESFVVKKALELACETIKAMCPHPYYICGGAIAERLGIPTVSLVKDYEYFIEQAKKVLEKGEQDG